MALCRAFSVAPEQLLIKSGDILAIEELLRLLSELSAANLALELVSNALSLFLRFVTVGVDPTKLEKVKLLVCR